MELPLQKANAGTIILSIDNLSQGLLPNRDTGL